MPVAGDIDAGGGSAHVGSVGAKVIPPTGGACPHIIVGGGGSPRIGSV